MDCTSHGKEGIQTWQRFKAEVIKAFNSRYAIFYRRYKLRTMKQGRTESLRATPQISKNMLALWAYRTMKIWFTSTCLLSSLNDKYRKNAWGVVANQFSHKMPNTLDPVIQAVLTLTEGEISAHNDSDTSEEDDEEQFEKKKRTKKNKNSFATSANSNMCRYCKKSHPNFGISLKK